MAFYRGKRFIFGLAFSIISLGLLWHASRSPAYWKEAHVDELNGLLYMVSHTNHILPVDLDLSQPVKHSVWIPAGERSSSRLWEDRMAIMNSTYPLVVFSKTYCPYSRMVKSLLAEYKIEPAPKIVEVDTRNDGGVIKTLLIRLTNRGTFPNVILKGKSLGGYDDLNALHIAGRLKEVFTSAGLQIASGV